MLGPGGDVLAPDGSAYLVAVRNSPKGSNSLLAVPVAGGQPRTLVRLKQPEHFLAGFAWSPDSRYVYFPRTDNSGTDLLRVPASGGPVESTPLHMPTIRNLSIHPDGKRIAFQSGDPDWELWALDGFLSQ